MTLSLGPRPSGNSWILRVVPSLIAILLFSGSAFGQISCTSAGTTPTVHSEGLAELVGDLTITCSGGAAASQAALTIFISLNTNITNRLDVNGALQGISLTVNTGGGAVPVGSTSLYSSTTIFANQVNYTVPAIASSPVIIAIKGLRAAVGTLANGTGVPVVNATIGGIGASFSGVTVVPVAYAFPTLLASSIVNGIPCSGSPLPATQDFGSFASGTVSSTIRITEASAASFTAKDGVSDSGVRFLINLSGYSAGSRIFVPDAIVGLNGSTPTSAGAYNTSVSGGFYSAGANQLLLVRVNGADAMGAGGSPVLPGAQLATATFSSLSEIGLTAGAGTVVYEVVNANPNLKESAQLPVFLVSPQIACTGVTIVPSLSVSLAPVSNVTIASQADPIPRFIAGTPASDCTQVGDCSATYFPMFTADTTPLNFSAQSQGGKQGANLAVANVGGGIVNFTVGITYPAGAAANWLTVTPSSGQATAQAGSNLQVFADPSALQPGIYLATINVDGGTYGKFATPVTFNVAAPGVTIQNVLNAASGLSPVAPGSYTALYGLNMGGQSVGVTFNGFPATLIYQSATQINLIVPAALGAAPAADVVVKVDGKTSNSFKVNLVPNAPGIFTPGIINSDGSVNTVSSPAKLGSYVAVYFTGLMVPVPDQTTVRVNIGNQLNLVPLYAGAQPTLPALDQVNVIIPQSLTPVGGTALLSICVQAPGLSAACSNQVNLYVQ